MWFLTDKGINKKLGYLKSIADLHKPDRIKYLLNFKPEQLHQWIDILRQQGDCDDHLQKIAAKATLLLRYMLQNPHCSKDVIWIFRDLLGHDPISFTSIEMTDNEISMILQAITTNQYEAYPCVIMARYVAPIKRRLFFEPIMDYAEQSQHNMSWAMTGEACETLAFLNCYPQQSMRCFSAHLNDDGFDGYPAHNILGTMHVFKKHGAMIIDELIKYLKQDDFGVDVYDTSFYVKCLSRFVITKDVALKLLPLVCNSLKHMSCSDFADSIDSSDVDESHAEANKLVMLLYGQLQAIIHGHLR